MITQKQSSKGGLILATKYRKAGRMERDGKEITWEDRQQILLLPFEADTIDAIRKYSVAPAYEKEFLRIMEDIHWGCLVEIEFENREVVSLVVVEDALANFYDNK